MEKRNVTAAVIRQGSSVLLCRRPADKQLGGFWEFPGGKQEENESLEDCLKREIQEELGTTITIAQKLGTEENDSFRLHFYLCTIASNPPRALEHSDICFADRKQLEQLELAPMDEKFVQDYADQIFQKPRRLFLALSLPESVQDALIETMDQWKKLGICGRFTKQSNLHITLVFIGDSFQAGQIEDILMSMPAKPFDLCLNQAGHFGSLWFAALEPCFDLVEYVTRMKSALCSAGVQIDRKPFKSHITLLRKAQIPESVSVRELKVSPASWQACQVVLYQSDLRGGSPVYIPICTRYLR